MALPEMTVDVDGVLCRPPTWFNLAISRNVVIPPVVEGWKPRPASITDQGIARPFVHALRFAWRLPMPGCADGLATLATMRRLVLLSGRSSHSRASTEAWLNKHGLAKYFSDMCLNDTDLSNAAFKLKVTRERNIAEHIDDDGRVVYFLAKSGLATVYLVAWRRNAGLPYPGNVMRVPDVPAVAESIARRSRT